MARLWLEQALPANWADDVFEAYRQVQYSRELLFPTFVQLTKLVSLAPLYDRVNHTEPAIVHPPPDGSGSSMLYHTLGVNNHSWRRGFRRLAAGHPSG